MTTRTIHAGRVAAVALLLVAVIALAGCGSSSSSGGSSASSTSHVHFAKTKFLLHAGLAFGAFHRYIYKPFRSGGFTPLSSHLSKLVSPLTALQTRLGSLGQQLHSGHLIPAAITGANSSVRSVTRLGAASGTAIHDLETPSLGQ